jgi:hypothetical protein
MGVDAMKRLVIFVLLPLVALELTAYAPAAPAMAATTNQITFSNAEQSDGGCLFTVSFSWSGYSGGSNDSLTLSLRSTYTDNAGTHDMEIASQPFSPISGRGGTQSYAFATFSGNGGSIPLIAVADWYGRALLTSKPNGQGLGRTLADSKSASIHAACRAG